MHGRGMTMRKQKRYLKFWGIIKKAEPVREDGRESCAEKSKEIQGWGQVTCNEVSESEVTGVEHHWWDDIFGNNNNHNNNNNGGHGKP